MQKVTPFLWFDKEAEEAMIFYTSVFKNSKRGEISRYGEAGPGPKGSVMTEARHSRLDFACAGIGTGKFHRSFSECRIGKLQPSPCELCVAKDPLRFFDHSRQPFRGDLISRGVVHAARVGRRLIEGPASLSAMRIS